MKRIEVCKMKVGDLKHNFGNPRKISKRKTEELERSMDLFGDFGIFLVDEQDNVIAGNQRSVILARRDPDIEVDVKRLIGYSEAELRSINIMDNTHAGEWDLELLADWTADLNLDLGIDLNNESPEERNIKGTRKRLKKAIMSSFFVPMERWCDRCGTEGLEAGTNQGRSKGEGQKRWHKIWGGPKGKKNHA